MSYAILVLHDSFKCPVDGQCCPWYRVLWTALKRVHLYTVACDLGHSFWFFFCLPRKSTQETRQWHTDGRYQEMKGASLSFSFTCTFFVMHIVNNADTYRSCCVPLGFDDIRLGCYCTDTGVQRSSKLRLILVCCYTTVWGVFFVCVRVCADIREKLKRWGNHGRHNLTMQPFRHSNELHKEVCLWACMFLCVHEYVHIKQSTNEYEAMFWSICVRKDIIDKWEQLRRWGNTPYFILNVCVSMRVRVRACVVTELAQRDRSHCSVFVSLHRNERLSFLLEPSMKSPFLKLKPEVKKLLTHTHNLRGHLQRACVFEMLQQMRITSFMWSETAKNVSAVKVL